jgi:hypothetical protein
LGDVLKLQTEIATAMAEALKVTRTRNPAAFDAYLRGRKAYERSEAKDFCSHRDGIEF